MRTAEEIARARAVPIATLISRGHKLRRQSRSEWAGPCPRCGGTDRFSINTGKNCWHCRGCKPPDVPGDPIGLVMHLHRISFPQAVEMLIGPEAKRAHGLEEPVTASKCSEPTTNVCSEPSRTVALAGRLWREAGPIVGSPGQVYLERWRGITELPPDVHGVLRFHPRVPFGQEHGQKAWRACIVCLFRGVVSNQATGIHRVAISNDGKPHPILGPKGEQIKRLGLGIKQGSAIKLWSDAEVSTALTVGEGFETVLAATQITHRGTLLQPAWAMVDAENLRALPVLPGIEFLTVLSDADDWKERGKGSGVWYQPGQDAARQCAKRWAAGGVPAEVLTPDRLGHDFNDLIKQIRAGVS
jgi:hypothetical protein